MIKPLSAHGQWSVKSLTFDQKGALLASADNGVTIQLWKRRSVYHVTGLNKEEDNIERLGSLRCQSLIAMDMRPDGKMIAAVTNQGYLKIWDLQGYKKEKITTIDQALTNIYEHEKNKKMNDLMDNVVLSPFY